MGDSVHLPLGALEIHSFRRMEMFVDPRSSIAEIDGGPGAGCNVNVKDPRDCEGPHQINQ
jgi:hypothetical protein